MTNDEQRNDISELKPEETKAVIGGASAVEYGLVAATISQEIIKAAPILAAKLAPTK